MRISDLQQQLAQRDLQLQEMHERLLATHRSSSWRITSPLRFAARQVRRVPRALSLALPAFRLGGGVTNTFKKAANLYLREGVPGLKRGFRQVAQSVAPAPVVDLVPAPMVDSSQPLDRVEKTLKMIKRDGLGLEIGASHNPMAPKKAGYNVHVLDHCSAEELRVKFAPEGVNIDNIEEVDFVWQGQPFSELIGRDHCYDWIIASHVIEHVTDVVDFLQQCEKLLVADGVLSLIVPDKRYCFDYYRWPSSTGEALQAYTEKRVRHSPGTVFDFCAHVGKLGEAIVWSKDDRGQMNMIHTLDEVESIWKLALKNEQYIDCHSWRFTPSSFRIILNDLQKLGLTNLVEVGSYATTGFEFWITLGLNQGKNGVTYDRHALCDAVMLEMEESIQCIK